MVSKSLRADERGSVIPLFGICALVVFGTVAVAIDYSRAASSRSEMQAALDAASKHAAGK